MMRNKSGFVFLKNRLDTFHVFTKEWRDSVKCKIGHDCESMNIMNIIHDILSKIFDYVETRIELRELQKCFKELTRNNKKN